MSWKDETKTFINNALNRYDTISQSTRTFVNDCNDVIQHLAYSADRISNSRNKSRNDSRNNSSNHYSENKKNNDSIDSRIQSYKLPDPDKLSQMINIKNKYFWKNNIQLQDMIKTETDIAVPDISSLIRDAMRLKVDDPKYSGIARINYDSNIASQDMKEEFIRAYTSSDKTLKQVSLEFEKKYGMHISVSTISNNARKYLSSKGLEFKNRREAKKYYQNMQGIPR